MQQRLLVALAKHNKQAEQRILEIIQQERERVRWKQLSHSMSPRKGRSVRIVQRVADDGTTQEAGTQREVENMIWDEIHGKRFFLAEQAPICQGWSRGEFGYMTSTLAAERVLDGSYEYQESMHQGTRELLEEAGRILKVILKDSVDTMVTTQKWQQKWNGADERTSSSESGLHFGHYKAGAKSDLISKHDALKVIICLKRAFHWRDGQKACRVC